MKELYNYKEVFDAPITIRKLFNDYTLPFAVSVSRIVIILVTLLILLLFKDFINSMFSGASLLIYIAVPWLTSKYLMRIQPNGKKLHDFLFDFVQFFFTVFLPKNKYCHDEIVCYVQKAEFKSHDVKVKIRRQNTCN